MAPFFFAEAVTPCRMRCGACSPAAGPTVPRSGAHQPATERPTPTQGASARSNPHRACALGIAVFTTQSAKSQAALTLAHRMNAREVLYHPFLRNLSGGTCPPQLAR